VVKGGIAFFYGPHSLLPKKPNNPTQCTSDNTMTFPQHLFRRHVANRNRDENDNPTNSNANNVDGNMNESNSSTNTNNEPTTTIEDGSTTTNDDGEQELVVQIPTAPHLLPQSSLTFIPPSPHATEHRRQAILAEVERVQRANFIHFALLCLVPTSLLLIVIAAIVSEDGECSGADGVTVCEREERSFVNAFTTRCVCDAVMSVMVQEEGEDGDGLF